MSGRKWAEGSKLWGDKPWKMSQVRSVPCAGGAPAALPEGSGVPGSPIPAPLTGKGGPVPCTVAFVAAIKYTHHPPRPCNHF